MYLVDTDPGLDDAHAIAMATRAIPHDQLVVTTVAGNTGLAQVSANAGWLLGVFAPTVPLHHGAAGPILGPPVDATHIHGSDGLGGFPRSTGAVVPREAHAATAIARLARAHAGELHVIALGPLTNIALAVALEPDLPRLVASLTIMGGSPARRGNASPYAEFNIFADSVAAETVFSSMLRITLLTWDTSLATRFTREELAGFWSGGSAEARLLDALGRHRAATDPRYAASTDYGRADPLAMAVALQPDCVATARSSPVRVVHDGGPDHGVTVVADHDDGRAGELTGRRPVRIVETFHRDLLLRALTV